MGNFWEAIENYSSQRALRVGLDAGIGAVVCLALRLLCGFA